MNLAQKRQFKQPAPSIYNVIYQNGRRPQTVSAKPFRRLQHPLSEKEGALSLTHLAYGQPENDLPGIIPLHLNENLFTAATTIDKAQMAALAMEHLESLHTYPINGMQQLQKAIADSLHIKQEKVVIGLGSSALLRNLVYYLLKTNETLLMPDPGWSFYRAIAKLVNAKIETFPLLDTGNAFVYDKNIIATHIERRHPKVVLICSPNNPTGNVMPIEDFLWLVRRYPNVHFILDEAYYGFANTYTAVQEKALLNSVEQQNLFVIRTFSKFYGLANLRLGFLICSSIDAQNLQKIAPVFGLPSLSQALAAQRLADKDYGEKVQQEYADVRAYLLASLKQLPSFTPYKTFSNFVLVRHDNRWSMLEKTLLDYGYKIKRETINGAHNYLRITLADKETMVGLLSVIRQLAQQETAVA